MKRKGIIVCGIIIIFLIIFLIASLNSRISSTINKNGDNLPIIDSIIEKKYISKEEGKDEKGNQFFILHYNSNDIDEACVNSFTSLLVEDYGFYEMNYNTFEDGIQFACNSKENDKMWVITIYYDMEEAYIKYTKCASTLFNDTDEELNYNDDDEHIYNVDDEIQDEIEYLDPYVPDEIKKEEPYYDSETNQYFDSYLDYESYKFYENYDGPDLESLQLVDEELENEQGD